MAETAGAPATISHARVLKIALPIMLSNVTVPLLGLVDTGVVGQLGEAARNLGFADTCRADH